MKTIYNLKPALTVFIAVFAFGTMFAQTPKFAEFEEIATPVKGEDGNVPFKFLFQSSAAWGDFNNDGYLDVVATGINLVPQVDENGNPVLNEDGNPQTDWVRTTVLYKNNGDETFTEIDNPFPRMDVSSVTWLDYDNDGNLDLFMTGAVDMEGTDRYSSMWHNLGSEYDYAFEEVFEGDFGWIHNGGGNRASHYVAAADYNNDGWVDLVMLGADAPDHSYTMLYRNAGGMFFSEVAYPIDGNKPLPQMRSGSVAWGDFNNDGYLDLIMFGYVDEQPEYGYNWGHGGVGLIFANNGDGTFTQYYQFTAGEDGEASIADFNNDGYLDFMITGYSWWPDTGWETNLHINNGDGTFREVKNGVSGLPGTQSNPVTWGDLNNDGFEDLTMYNVNPFSIYYNNYADDTFTPCPFVFGEDQHNLYIRGGAMCFVDYDNDNNLDVFLNGYDDRNEVSHLMKNNLGEDIPSNQAPSAPTNLKAETDAEGITTFTWDAATDDITPAEALRYNLYVEQDGVTRFVLPADINTGRLKVNETLAPINITSYKMHGLEGEFTWGVQAIDNAKATSKFAKSDDTGISSPNNWSSFKVFGNKNAIEITANNGLEGIINVYSAGGASLYTKSGQINNTIVNLPSGMYIVKVTSNEGVKAEKVIVK